MQRHSGYSQSLTALPKFGGSIFGFDRAQPGEQWPFLWQVAEYLFQFRPECDFSELPCLSTMKTDSSVIPVDVFGEQLGDIPLSSSRVPANLVESLSLGIVFPLDYPLVLFFGNRPLRLEFELRPKFLWHDRPRQPGPYPLQSCGCGAERRNDRSSFQCC